MSMPVRVGAPPSVIEHGHTKRGDGGKLSSDLIRELARRPVLSTTATLSVTNENDVILVDATGGARTANLPPAGLYVGIVFTIVKVDASANAVTVDGNGAETINGAATYALTVQYQSVTVCSSGSAWFVL